MKQKTLFKLSDYRSDFGGTLLAGKRKTRRPLSSKNPVHLVLRANITKSGSLLKHRLNIDKYFKDFSRRFDVKVYEMSLVSNHIHVVAHFKSRNDYKQFIRAFAGTLASQLKIKWGLRPWSRLLKWGRALKAAIQYTVQNHLEAVGAIPYQLRGRRGRGLFSLSDEKR